MENETAQLIAAIENVLADAEVGPNAGGYWLHEAATASTSTTLLTTNTLEYINETTTKISLLNARFLFARKELRVYDKLENHNQKNENKEFKEDLSQQKSGKEDTKEEEEEESEEDEETEENDQDILEKQENVLNNSTKEFNNLKTKINGTGENTTKSTFSTTKIIPVISEKFSKKKEGIKYIPEAEEEEQAADIASLQLDSVAAPVLPESSNISIIKTSSSMPETSKTAVPNLFNLPVSV
uniref:Candidate secreted effector n=1 Tax=Meloidogyne incognita TaxID=6306 RepID=A0A914M3C0_MELIC